MLEHLPENVRDIIRELTNKIIIIEKYTEYPKDFKRMVEKFYDYTKQGFEFQELRTCPVHFKFFDKDDAMIYSLQLRHFVTNMIFWEPLVKIGSYGRINESYIVDATTLSQRTLKSYIDNKIIIPFRYEVGNAKLNTVIHDMLYRLSRISKDFNFILGLTINMESMINVANENPRFDELLHTKIDDSMQPNEIEDHLKRLTREQIGILKTTKNVLQPMFLAETGIKEGQFKEFAVNSGLAPDLDGTTIPIPINANFIVGGLSNITNYYIDALKGRKAAVMNKTQMGLSGYFSRMVMLLSSDVKLSKGEEDCRTLHPLKINIRTEEHLRRYIGRNYRMTDERRYRTIVGDEKHLIGKDILLRSPITCASKKICKMCYGDLYYTNRDLESVGGFAGTEITNPLSQSILSSKHLLTTQSVMVAFAEEFYNFFTVNANEIVVDVVDDVDANQYTLVFIKDNIQTIDDFDELEFNSYVKVFQIRNKTTGEIIDIMEDSAKELYITPELKKLMKKDKGQKQAYEIELGKVPDGVRLFAVEISNNELTRPLYDIMDLMNHDDHIGCRTLDDMGQTMTDLLITSGIPADSVHGEVIIRPIIRSFENVLERPNFRKYGDAAAYQIMTVKSALRQHPSVLISLSFQDLNRQLVNPLTYKKVESSFVDPFFSSKP